MRKQYFTGDQYVTPMDYRRAWGDKIFSRTRLYFLYKLAGVVLRGRKKANKKEYDAEAFAASSYDIFKIIESCKGRFHIKGMNNIKPGDGPYVFISNHMSSLETMIFPCIILPKVDISFVVKESLINYPYFGDILRATNPIVVSRENSRLDLMHVVTTGQKMLSEGKSVIIFPQSTRQTEFKPELFNTLGVKLAAKAKVKVIPVAIKTNFWGNGKLVKDLGPLHRDQKIHMEFGKPYNLKETGVIENQKIITFIQNKLNKWNKKKE